MTNAPKRRAKPKRMKPLIGVWAIADADGWLRYTTATGQQCVYQTMDQAQAALRVVCYPGEHIVRVRIVAAPGRKRGGGRRP